MRRSVVIILLVVFELTTIIFLYHNLRKAKDTRISVDPIKKNFIGPNKMSELRYFYEPIAGSLEKDASSWLNEPVTYAINKDTLNELRDYETAKPHNTYRIVVLGDSFAFGQNASTKDNWTELLEDKVNKAFQLCKKGTYAEVINLGARGYDLQYEVERFRLRGVKYNPDLVLWLVKDDDLDVVNELLTPIKEETVQKLKQENKYTEGYENTLEGYVQILKLFKGKYSRQLVENKQAEFLDQYSRMTRAQTIFINYEQFRDRTNVILRKVLTSKSMTVQEKIIDLDPKSDTYAPADYHLNRKGNAKMAQAVYALLLKKGVMNCGDRKSI